LEQLPNRNWELLLCSLEAAEAGKEGWQERKKRRKKRRYKIEYHKQQLGSWDPESFYYWYVNLARGKMDCRMSEWTR
jgi:hypothetical protein